jgi:signal transduction histidine kinase
MRRRLVLSYGSLLSAVVLALAVPLAVISVRRDSQRLVTARLTDAAYLASMAEPALRTGELPALESALHRYDELYGICAVVVDADGHAVARSAPSGVPGAGRCTDSTVISGDLTVAIGRALAGDQVGPETRIWPWGPPWLLTAVPVLGNAEVIGAVVAWSATAGVRSSAIRTWAIIGAGGSLTLALWVLAAVLVAHWTVRPIGGLRAAVKAVAAGQRDIRAPVTVGPPELRLLACAFNDMARAVSDTLTRRDAFASHACHQLRNALNTLLLRLEALGEEPMSADGTADYRLAVEEVRLLQRMLDGLLAVSGAEGATDRIEITDAVAVATDRLRAWLPRARERRISLGIEAAPSPVLVRTVVTGLEQTLDILLDNAFKFGSRTVTVRVIGHRPPQVHVVDDGRGLEPGQLQSATERFWRAPGVRDVPGCGLGLSIATALTEAAGGNLELRAADGGGLRVELTLSAAD